MASMAIGHEVEERELELRFVGNDIGQIRAEALLKRPHPPLTSGLAASRRARENGADA